MSSLQRPDHGRIVIAGAGSQGLVVADILQRAREAGSLAYPIGFVDDTPALQRSRVGGLDVLGPFSALAEIPHDSVIVAIGDNLARRRVAEELLARGEMLATAIHPFASVAPSATLGPGTMICAGAIVAVQVVLGQCVIVNTKASIDHETIVDDFAHVSAGATVGGRVHIGGQTLIALGASIISGASVGSRTVIGAGAVVVGSIPDDVTAFGVPARVRSERSA